MKNVRYFDTLAEALILELKDVSAQDRALNEFEEIWRAFSGHTDIRDRVLHASLPLEKRLAMLEAAVKDRVDPAVEHVVLILLRDRALVQLPKFIERFKATRKRLELARDVMVTSAVTLTEAERTRLKKALEKKWGLSVSLTERVDPTMIGGLKLTAGDWQYDATARGRLQRLARRLKTA